jgi:bifunctional non-homologous end joining protein LigD
MDKTLKFVVQKHTKKGLVHWDLMFETGPVLQTYRLDLPPEKLSLQANTAIKIFDHPLKFLTYQGSVNKGLGTVEIADYGIYTSLTANLKQQELLLQGKILKGNFRLTLIEKDKWEFNKI